MNMKIIPIMVKEGDTEGVWYMDVSNLGLRELLELRGDLKGTISNSIAAIDSIVSTSYISDNAYNSLENSYKRKSIKSKKRKNDSLYKYHRR